MEDQLSTMEAHQGTGCDICGDIGVIDALQICPQCKVSCEHIYCMSSVVGTDPLEDWSCDDCRCRTKLLSPTSAFIEDIDCGSPLSTASRPRENFPPDEQPCDSRQNRIDKKVPRGKVKYIHAEEVIMLSSGAKQSNSPVKSTNTSSWRNRAPALDKTPVKPKAIAAKSSMHIVQKNPPFVSPKQLKAGKPNSSQSNMVPGVHLPQSSKGLREAGALQASLKGQMQKEHRKVTFKDEAEIRVAKAISKTVSATSQATYGRARVHSVTETGTVQVSWNRQMQKQKPRDTSKEKAEIRLAKAITETVSASSQATYGQAMIDSETGTVRTSWNGQMQNKNPKDTFKEKADFMVGNAIVKTVSVSSPATCGQASISSGGDAFPDLELKKTDPRTAGPIGIFPEVGKCSSGPASDATWKGNFKIYNDPEHREMNGLQAYPPSRVLRKVYEFSKTMPDVLGFELIPRGDLWANLFQKYSLDGGDIGLYFLPGCTDRCRSCYFSLLEAMEEEDLAMRNLLDGAELLIFTSKVLRLECQKWRGRHFLWGVFHSLRKVKRHACQGNGAHELPGESNSNQDIDMDIDMMAGEVVGKVDVAVPRESLQVVPPAKYVVDASSMECDDMEIDMVGGKEVGKRDIVVSREAHIDVPPGFENRWRPIKNRRT